MSGQAIAALSDLDERQNNAADTNIPEGTDGVLLGGDGPDSSSDSGAFDLVRPERMEFSNDLRVLMFDSSITPGPTTVEWSMENNDNPPTSEKVHLDWIANSNGVSAIIDRDELVVSNLTFELHPERANKHYGRDMFMVLSYETESIDDGIQKNAQFGPVFTIVDLSLNLPNFPSVDDIIISLDRRLGDPALRNGFNEQGDSLEFDVLFPALSCDPISSNETCQYDVDGARLPPVNSNGTLGGRPGSSGSAGDSGNNNDDAGLTSVSDESDGGGGGGGGGLSTGAKVGVGLGAAAGFLILVGLAGFLFFLRRRRRSRRILHPGTGSSDHVHNDYGGGGIGASSSRGVPMHDYLAEKEASGHHVAESPYSEDGPGMGGSGNSRGSALLGGPYEQHEATSARGFAPYSDAAPSPNPATAAAAGPAPGRALTESARAESRTGARSETPDRGNVPRTVAHLVEDGMTDEQIRRLEEEERALDHAIAQAGRGGR